MEEVCFPGLELMGGGSSRAVVLSSVPHDWWGEKKVSLVGDVVVYLFSQDW